MDRNSKTVPLQPAVAITEAIAHVNLERSGPVARSHQLDPGCRRRPAWVGRPDRDPRPTDSCPAKLAEAWFTPS